MPRSTKASLVLKVQKKDSSQNNIIDWTPRVRGQKKVEKKYMNIKLSSLPTSQLIKVILHGLISVKSS